MGIEIKITNNTDKIRSELQKATQKALEECGLTGEGYAKMACPVDTGMLRNSLTHKVVEDEKTCYIGTNTEYAAYVELGTGIYYNGGRRTPWCYQDSHGDWHMTQGQKAQPYLKPAVADHQTQYNSIIKKELENG